MFAIYKYTLKKYLKAPSTWIILAISVFIAGFLGGYLPYTIIDTNKSDAASNYGLRMVMIVSEITSFLAIFVSVFAGFKASTMFKDEVEDGTFLVMLSKPITRSKIVFGKWLALQTMMAAYTFITVLSYVIVTSIADTGSEIKGLSGIGIKTISSQIVIVGIFMWAILMVIGFIFTSIALLLSTKLSSGATIGISIGLGVIIPVTSLVSMFTVQPEYEKTSSNQPFIFNTSFDQIKKNLEDEATKGTTNPAAIANIKSAIATTKSAIDSIKTIYNDAYKEISNNKDGLLNFGLNVKGTDSFKFAWITDLNFQIQTLSSFASERMVPDAMKESLKSSSNSSAPAIKTSTTKIMDSGVALDTNSIGKIIKGQIYAIHAVEENIKTHQSKTKPKLTTGDKLIDANNLMNIGINSKLTDTIKAALKANYNLSGNYDFSNMKGTWGHKIPATPATPAHRYWLDITSEDFWKLSYPKLMTPIEELIRRIHSLSNRPFSFMFDEKKLKDYNISSKEPLDKNLKFDFVFPKKPNTKKQTGNKQNTKKPKGNKQNTKKPKPPYYDWLVGPLANPQERNIYNMIVNAAADGKLKEVETVDYVSRNTILWIYLILAAALVPTSFLIIRKQDFR